MVESKAIQVIVNQVAIQAATAVVMVLAEVDAGPMSHASTASLNKVHRKTWQTSSKTAFI